VFINSNLSSSFFFFKTSIVLPISEFKNSKTLLTSLLTPALYYINSASNLKWPPTL